MKDQPDHLATESFPILMPQADLERIARLAARVLDVPAVFFALRNTLSIQDISCCGTYPPTLAQEVMMRAQGAWPSEMTVVPDIQHVSAIAAPILFSPREEARFYACLPLPSCESSVSGFLGLLDTRPRTLTPEERALLADLAELAGNMLDRYCESEERWRRLVEHHPDALLILEEGRIGYANPAGLALLGAAEKDILGQSVFSFVAPPHHRALQGRLEDLACGRPATLTEYTISRPDGQTRQVESVGVAITFWGRKAVLAILRDVTTQRLYEKSLIKARLHAEEMNRVKSAFLANISHEIRTPLTGILGFADIMYNELPDVHRTMADLIKKSGTRLMETINSVLDLAQLESNSVRLMAEPFDVTAQIKETVALFRPHAELKDLSLSVEAPEPIQVVTDRAMINRICSNLLSNAIKFTQRGTITIAACARGEAFEIQVRDTGIGIASEFLPVLFEPFRQESEGSTRRYQGNGLGLNITQRLVTLLGGQISVTSELGQGSTFTLQIPTHLQDGSASEAEPRNARFHQRTSRPSA